MIDVHCHLEQSDYDRDRDEVIEKCKKELKAVITCCAHPRNFDLTIQMVNKYENFIFTTVSIHPIHIKEVDEKQQKEFFELIRKDRNKIVGIGETGLDYEIEEEEFREKQKQLFLQFIELSKELNLPMVVHGRAAFE